MHSDEIIESVGGMSGFQVLLIFVILGPRLIISWGMLMMSFAGVPPEHWWCVDDVNYVNGTIYDMMDYKESKKCPSDNITCTSVYSQEKDTVVNKWDLLCEDKGIRPLIIAIQMGGVMVGCILAGQSADAIGRKKTHVISILLHAGFNLVAAFSVSWQMFAALRFLIGSMVGAVLTVSFPYYMEFVGQKWRPVTSVAAWWQIGSSLFALSCWLRPSWFDLHIIASAMHIPFFIGLIFVPESFRWLAVHGHLKEAEKVVDQMARYNGTQKPANTARILKELAEEELRARESSHKYTYIDIYSSWSLCWKSFIIQFTWMCLSFVFYGISFGVGRLHGNLYLNMFLVSVIGIPGIIAVYFLNNRIGRRWTCFGFFVIATVGAFGVVVASRFGGNGPVTTAFALTCRLGVGAAWNCYQLISGEAYPTPIRNLGYGAANSAARVGAIISPYAFAMGGDDLLPPFVIVGSLMAVCAILCLFIRETKGTPLEDTSKQIPLDVPKHENINIFVTGESKVAAEK